MTKSKPIEITMDQNIFEDFDTQEEIDSFIAKVFSEIDAAETEHAGEDPDREFKIITTGIKE
jgi:hypothetical protein